MGWWSPLPAHTSSPTTHSPRPPRPPVCADLQAGKAVVTRSLSVRASASQQLLVIDSPSAKRATPTHERARPPAAKRRLRVLEDLDSSAVDFDKPAAPLAAPTASLADTTAAVPEAAPPSLFDNDGFLKEVVWDGADAAARGRVWADATAWCAAWSDSINQPAAQDRRARWSAALNVPRVRAEMQLLAKFKVPYGVRNFSQPTGASAHVGAFHTGGPTRVCSRACTSRTTAS